MKISATIEIPRNKKPRNAKYAIPKSPFGKRVVPGTRTKPL